MKLLGTTYLNKVTLPLVEKYKIMLLEHMDSPDGVVAKSDNYTARLMERDWDGVDNPRHSWLRCSVIERYVAPNNNLLDLQSKDPTLLNQICGFLSSDYDAADYRDNPAMYDEGFIVLNGNDFSTQITKFAASASDDWFTIGKITVFRDRVLSVLTQAGFTEEEIHSTCKSTTFCSEIMSKELTMYTQWKNQKAQLHKLVITDNHTNDVVFLIDPYYTVQFRYNFTDVHAAFWIGQLEEELRETARVEPISDMDLEL